MTHSEHFYSLDQHDTLMGIVVFTPGGYCQKDNPISQKVEITATVPDVNIVLLSVLADIVYFWCSLLFRVLSVALFFEYGES